MLFGFGVVVMLALQAALNIGVTTSLLPNKGLPLPFISYGGSNLLIMLACVGFLLSIARQAREAEGVKGILAGGEPVNPFARRAQAQP